MSYFRTGIVAAAGDVTVSDASGTIASTNVNGALTELSLRSPFQPGQFAVACVDYDGRTLAGNDTTAALGIGSTLTAALNAAKLTPFKTLDRLQQVLPGNGNGANLQVLIRARTGGATYRNIANTADQTGSWRSNLNDYARICSRPTGDFSDSAADRIQMGFVTATGLNAAGYNPTGTPTNNTFSVQLAGGGAANLPTEVTNGTSSITGLRIRFDPATATVALQNKCAMIWKNTASQIIVSANLAAVPTTSDVFYIEQTELQLGAGSSTLKDVSVTNLCVAGERWTAATTFTGFPSTILQIVACEQSAGSLSVTRCGQFTTNTNSFFADGTFSAVGTSGRFASTANNFSDMTVLTLSSCAFTAGLINLIQNVQRYQGLGQGCVFALGINDANGSGLGGSSTAANQSTQRSLGNTFSSATTARLRITAAGGSGAGIFINCSGVQIRGVDIANQTAALVQIGGGGTVTQNISVAVDDLVSTDGNNTAAVLKMAGQNCTVRWGIAASNTAAAARDIDMSNGAAICTFAGLATTNYFDDLGNNVIGSAGIIQDKPGKVVTNRTATTAIGQIIRSNATSNEGTLAKADTVSNAAGIIGVALNAAAAAAGLLIAPPGSFAAVQFDSAPTAGNIGYLSTANAGNAQAAAPAVSGTNQKNRLGIVQKVSGSFGYMTFNPDKLAITADGAA